MCAVLVIVGILHIGGLPEKGWCYSWRAYSRRTSRTFLVCVAYMVKAKQQNAPTKEEMSRIFALSMVLLQTHTVKSQRARRDNTKC